MGTAAIAAVPSLAGIAGVAGVARASGGDEKKRQFSLVALTGSSKPDKILLDGGGFFNEEDVEGQGGFTHFSSGPPGPIAGFGRWKAKKLVNFTQVGTTVGSHLGGILRFTVDLRSSTGLRIRNLNMEVVCNFPIPTGFTEGVTLTGTGLPTDFDTAISPPSATLYSMKHDD